MGKGSGTGADSIDLERFLAAARAALGDDGDDAVQDALIRAWERGMLADERAVAALVRKTIDARRRTQARRHDAAIRHPHPTVTTDDIAEIVADRDELDAVVRAIPSNWLPLPELVLVSAGWSVSELARSLGLSTRTVLAMIARQRSLAWKRVRGTV